MIGLHTALSQELFDIAGERPKRTYERTATMITSGGIDGREHRRWTRRSLAAQSPAARMQHRHRESVLEITVQA